MAEVAIGRLLLEVCTCTVFTCTCDQWCGEMDVLHSWRKYPSKTAKPKMYLIKQRPAKLENRCINIYEITYK